MHTLNNVPTVIKHPADILSIHCAREVRVAVMPSITAGCADSQELISYEVLGPCDSWVFIRFWRGVIWRSVASKLGEVVLYFRFPC